MILRFSIENWMSFRDPATFSLIASRERQHGERIPRVNKYQTRVLPVAAVYGGNASGKTNLFKALNFVKRLVVKGTNPDSLIPVEPFRLDAKGTERPTRFSLELLVDDTIYEFSFATTRKTILEEKLVEISSTRENVMYHRLNGKPNFDRSLEKDQFLHFAFKGTRDNQLFLTNSVSQKVDRFRPVYNWFKDTLKLVAPDTRFGSFEQYLDEDHPLYETLNEMLRQLDTGIKHLGGEMIPFDNLPLPEPLKTRLQEDVKEGVTVLMLSRPPVNERVVITCKNGELVAKKLFTYHQRADGTEAKFDIRDESDGSQRVIELLPAFLDLSVADSNKVYVIDEIDRSLHTLLTRTLIEAYLAKCSPDTRAQLLFTTHDVLLMDQQLLRRDEMWVTERGVFGNSNLLSFSEYKKVRYDKDIRKSYLQGRLGGIPRIFALSAMNNACLVGESKVSG
jgi:uncharacterized protein